MINYVLAMVFFSFLNSFSQRLLFSLYSIQLGLDDKFVIYLGIIFSGVSMLFAWPAGRFMDRVGTFTPLVTSVILPFLGMLGVLVYPNYFTLSLCATMMGLSYAFFAGTLQNLVGIYSDTQTRVVNFSRFSMMGTLSNSIGSFVVGSTVEYLGVKFAAVVVYLLTLVPWLILVYVGSDLPKVVTKKKNNDSESTDFLKPGVGIILIMSGIVGASVDLFMIYVPLFAKKLLLPSFGSGIILSTFAAAMFFVRLVLSQLLKRIEPIKLLSFSLYFGSFAFLLFAFSTNIYILAIVAFLIGLGIGCGQPLTMMLAFDRSKGGRTGEVLGLRLSILGLAKVFSQIVLGPIGVLWGLPALFLSNSLILSIGGYLSKANNTELKKRLSQSEIDRIVEQFEMEKSSLSPSTSGIKT